MENCATAAIAHQRQNLVGRLNISEQGEQMEVLQPRPAPPLPLNLQRISSSAPQSVLPSEPNLFATFLFQASFYLFLLAGSCESCQMELTGWPLANSASRYYSLQFGRWTLMLSSRILAQISHWRWLFYAVEADLPPIDFNRVNDSWPNQYTDNPFW